MNIAFLGDSLTEGRPGASYYDLLRMSLPGHELFNLGRAGDRVADLEARLRDGGMPTVDLAFVWIGINDAFDDDDLVSVRLAFDRLLSFVRSHARNCVCVLPLLPDDDLTGGEDAYPEYDWHQVAKRAQVIAALISEVAAGREATRLAGGREATRLLDLHRAFAAERAANPAATFTIDGIHLSDRGAAVVARAFAAEVAEAATAHN
jgi:lysophospholipase L1-like esterase